MSIKVELYLSKLNFQEEVVPLKFSGGSGKLNLCDIFEHLNPIRTCFKTLQFSGGSGKLKLIFKHLT